MSYRKPVALLALAGVAVGVALAGSPAPAASTQPGGQTFEVTSTADAVDANPGNGFCAVTTGGCTLRAAIQEANVLPGHQTVILPAGEYVLTRNGYEENESSVGDLDITGDLTIVGAGASETGITEDAFAVDRIFDVREGVVAMRGLAIHDVHMSAILSGDETCGGGMRNAGDLTVAHVVIRDNVFRRGGGGICNRGGSLRLSDSLIEGNIAAFSGPGGGVLNAGGGLAILERLVISSNRGDTTGGGGIANNGSMIVRDSLITANTTGGQASGAGGIANSGASASLVVINSTISGNWTDPGGGAGGGVSTREEGATTTLINSIVTGNAASFSAGGGVSTREGTTTTLINTIVANNENLDCQQGVVSVPPVSLGHNLDSDGSCGLSGPGDLSGVDPLLGELADNGGPTLTHALLAGSPAIDAGDDAECPAADQRGAPRPSGGACDIGAYEAGAAVPPPASLPGDVDCDGALSPYDELALLRFVGSLGPPECIGLADVDCDGEASIVDALVLLRRLAGFIDEPCNPG
jgi:CSLREA domain-containing protein